MTARPSGSKLAARILAGTLAVATLTSIATPALAQPTTTGNDKTNQLEPPVPAPPRNPPNHLLGIGAAFLLAALVIGVNFIPSKRGHQD